MRAALPEGPPGRALALGIVLLLAALVWFGAVAPLLEWRAERLDALQRLDLLGARMTRVAASLPELERQAAMQSANGPAPSALLEGDTDAIAGAALLQSVQEMASRAGAAVSSTENLPGAESGAHRRIALRVAVNAPFGVLMRLLQEIDLASPQMLIIDLQAHGPRIIMPLAEPPVAAEFTVTAYRANAPAKAARAGPP